MSIWSEGAAVKRDRARRIGIAAHPKTLILRRLAGRRTCPCSWRRVLRKFVSEHKARRGLAITNDSTARHFAEKLSGLSFYLL